MSENNKLIDNPQRRNFVGSHSTEQKSIFEINRFFNSLEVRILGSEVNPIFYAKDIAKILGIKKVNTIVAGFDPIELVSNEQRKTLGIHTFKSHMGRLVTDNRMRLLTEFGVYRLMSMSKSEIASQFRQFIYQVLYELRTKGHYEIQAELEKLRITHTETLAECQKLRDKAHQLGAALNKLYIYELTADTTLIKQIDFDPEDISSGDEYEEYDDYNDYEDDYGDNYEDSSDSSNEEEDDYGGKNNNKKTNKSPIKSRYGRAYSDKRAQQISKHLLETPEERRERLAARYKINRPEVLVGLELNPYRYKISRTKLTTKNPRYRLAHTVFCNNAKSIFNELLDKYGHNSKQRLVIDARKDEVLRAITDAAADQPRPKNHKSATVDGNTNVNSPTVVIV